MCVSSQEECVWSKCMEHDHSGSDIWQRHAPTSAGASAWCSHGSEVHRRRRAAFFLSWTPGNHDEDDARGTGEDEHHENNGDND